MHENCLLKLSAKIVPNVCIRFREANHRTTPSFLRDSVSRDLSKDAIYILVPTLVTPFYQLIKLVYTHAHRSLPRLFLSYTNTMSRPFTQTLTLLLKKRRIFDEMTGKKESVFKTRDSWQHSHILANKW